MKAALYSLKTHTFGGNSAAQSKDARIHFMKASLRSLKTHAFYENSAARRRCNLPDRVLKRKREVDNE